MYYNFILDIYICIYIAYDESSKENTQKRCKIDRCQVNIHFMLKGRIRNAANLYYSLMMYFYDVENIPQAHSHVMCRIKTYKKINIHINHRFTYASIDKN